MTEQPHVENCPGCTWDLLTEDDRRHMAGPPRHVLVPPPEMPEIPPARSNSNRQFGLVLAILLSGVVVSWWFALGLTVLLVALWAYRLVRHKAEHRTPAQRRSGCPHCAEEYRAEVTKLWLDYRRLAEADQARRLRRAHAANYERLRRQAREDEGDQRWMA